jgi:glycosyltransferase involved in cell wall biosynthesis
MRIVLDLQGPQATNRLRGIGRYSLSLAQTIVRNRGEHEALIALNGLFPETIESIRAAFDGLLPQENIRIWHAPGPISQIESGNDARRKAAELLREAFLASLEPDIVHVSSLFEGLNDDAVASIGSFTQAIPTAVTLYDLIPHIYRKPYLESPLVERWYEGKLNHLLRANLWLAISESSRQEGIRHLGLPANAVINVSAAAEPCFRFTPRDMKSEQDLRARYGLLRPFVMYTGGTDHRKNIEGLIRAYACLSPALRQAHQLAIVCSVQPASRQALEQLATQHGLRQDEVVLTGYVPESDLLALYSYCKLFVFPSWHEGFGLPALEAMSCGAAVIGANTSSLPEVIGREDALFDPHSDGSISAKLNQALSDEIFRTDLVRHGLEQAKKFSWNDSARRAITAFERFHAKRQQVSTTTFWPVNRPKLAFVSPLPPERSGIADYSAELLPELARHYDIEVVVDQENIADPWVQANCAIRSPDWLRANAHRMDRVLYHFGNSTFHQHMFELLEEIPGIVVLHDFFLSGIQAHREMHGMAPHAWARELYQAHGYAAVQERYHVRDLADVVWKYPATFSILQQAQGVIAHSGHARRLAREWYGERFAQDWAVVPLLRAPSAKVTRAQAREALKLNASDFMVCSFGQLGPAKLNHRLLEVWLRSVLAKNERCVLVFVGENTGGDFGELMLQTIRRSGLAHRIRITGWTDWGTFRHYLAAADVAVQLRTYSRGETSAAVLDCMNHGLPTIVNANGSMADLPADAVWMLPDEFEDAQLIEALETLWQNSTRREALGTRAREVILTRHAPRACAEQYVAAIEGFHAKAKTGMQALIQAVAALDGYRPNDTECMMLAQSIAQNQPQRKAARQFLVDISELVQRDVRSGIQRVVRSILKELLANPPQGCRVEPVYATADRPGYRYARNFTLRFLGCPSDWLEDAPVEYEPGDIFLGLDLQPSIVPAQAGYLAHLHRMGVQVHFVVYDLLPVLLPHAYPSGADHGHTAWLQAVTRFNGAICISRAVADELSEWLKANGQQCPRPFRINWFHLGADIESSVPARGMPDDAGHVLARFANRPSFLMVGTIEPRKGHTQTLAAFEQLWAEGVDVDLVVVGKQGWMVEQLAKRLRHHAELGIRLWWLEGISDEYLEKVYAASTCLIAASEGEGFGLPIIEAAQHKLPIIARDIPVFREVAGDHAFYFKDRGEADLAAAVKEWLALAEAGRHPKPDGMPWLTWRESADNLKKAIVDNC